MIRDGGAIDAVHYEGQSSVTDNPSRPLKSFTNSTWDPVLTGRGIRPANNHDNYYNSCNCGDLPLLGGNCIAPVHHNYFLGRVDEFLCGHISQDFFLCFPVFSTSYANDSWSNSLGFLGRSWVDIWSVAFSAKLKNGFKCCTQGE